MKKKTIIILVIIGLIMICAMGYIHKRDKAYVSEEVRDEQRIESIQKFDARSSNVSESSTTAGTTTNKPNGINNGEGTVLNNRAAFLQKFENKDKDIGISIANNLIPSSLKYINYIIEDCEEDKIDNYFNTNKDTIYNVFGIDNITDFKNLYTVIKCLGNIGTVDIDIKTLEVLTNGANFTVNIKGENSSTTLYVQARVSNTKTMSSSFYLRVGKE